MPDYIRKRRKKTARAIRANTGKLVQKDGDVSTHIMESGYEEDEKGKKTYVAYPTIFPDKRGGYSQPDNALDEAHSRNEVFGFKRKKRAEKFAAGSWKPVKSEKKEAMKAYRKRKKNQR